MSKDRFLDRVLRAPREFVRDTTDRWLLRRLVNELAGIRKALEVQVDTTRAGLGLPQVFVDPLPKGDPGLAGAGEGMQPGRILHGGDFQLVWLLEELAAEQRVPVGPETDLEALALERGWLSPDGKLLVVPQSAQGMEVSGPWA